jgi:sugar phosphate isomerase/epimerase
MTLGLETFSYLPLYAAGKMDVFRFVERTHELGLDGVQINICTEREHWGMLGGIEPDRLNEVRRLTESLGMYVEVDTYGMQEDHLLTALRVSHLLGADVLRTYASTPDVLEGAALLDYMQPGGGLDRDQKRAAVILRRLLPTCADYGIRIAIENHEYETSARMLSLVKAVDSEWVGLLVDTGNMMMVWEDPLAAVTAMAPYAISTHFKDQAVIEEDDRLWVVGTPLGKGSIDCAACFEALVRHSSLHRINIEVCYGYRSSFRAPKDGGAQSPGQGAFRIQPRPHDKTTISPYSNYARSAMMTATAWEELLTWHEQAVVESVRYVKALNQAPSPRPGTS